MSGLMFPHLFFSITQYPETEQTFPAAGLKFSYAAMDESRLSAFLIEGQPSVFRV